MNGASAELCANTSSAPTSTNMIMIGRSHIFFRTRMNCQNSRVRLDPAIGILRCRGLERFERLELAFERAPRRLPSVEPYARGPRPMDERALAKRAAQQPNRREKNEIHDAHEHGRRDARDDPRQRHPRALDRAQRSRRDERAREEEHAERAENGERHGMTAPAGNAGEDDERGADGEPEL